MLSLFKASCLAFSKKPPLSPAVVWSASMSLHSCCLNLPHTTLDSWPSHTPSEFPCRHRITLHAFVLQCFAPVQFMCTGALCCRGSACAASLCRVRQQLQQDAKECISLSLCANIYTRSSSHYFTDWKDKEREELQASDRVLSSTVLSLLDVPVEFTVVGVWKGPCQVTPTSV